MCCLFIVWSLFSSYSLCLPLCQDAATLNSVTPEQPGRFFFCEAKKTWKICWRNHTNNLFGTHRFFNLLLNAVGVSLLLSFAFHFSGASVSVRTPKWYFQTRKTLLWLVYAKGLKLKRPYNQFKGLLYNIFQFNPPRLRSNILYTPYYVTDNGQRRHYSPPLHNHVLGDAKLHTATSACAGKRSQPPFYYTIF